MGETSVSTEVVVVGGGPGGYAAAFRAAQRGLDTTLVSDEPAGLGGVCLLRGCIPSKALLEMTGRVDRARVAAEAGIRFGDPEIDLDALREWTGEVVRGLVGGLGKLAEARGVRVVEGRGRFESSRRLRVLDSDVTAVEFEHAIVAAGARPVALPDLPFDGAVWDSARALELPEVPERLLVVGAGYVGLEMATVYARLGSAVTVVEEEDRILPLADPELAAPLARRLEGVLEELRLETSVRSLEAEEGGVVAELGGESESFDRVLVAIGRAPATEELGLEETEVTRDDDGFLVVDEERRTTDPRIFAVGDCTGGKGLDHEAMREGKVAADVLAGEPAAWDPRAVPAVVYTDPQVAWCGLTEAQAREGGGEVRVARVPLAASGRARTLAGSATDGLVKLVADDHGRLLGAGFCGPHVESLVAEAALALEMGATTADLALTIHPHPSLSETLAEAAELLEGVPTHVEAPDGSDRPGRAPPESEEEE
jgi:dihydrolipoamide dehydrogenase